jgi:hypothetical protein
MPDDFREPLGLLKKLRDDFVHGKLDDLSRSEAASFYAAIRKLAPDVNTQIPTLKDEDLPIILMTFLVILEVGLNAVFEDWRERRAQQEEAMREWIERRRPAALSREQIEELLFPLPIARSTATKGALSSLPSPTAPGPGSKKRMAPFPRSAPFGGTDGGVCLCSRSWIPPGGRIRCLSRYAMTENDLADLARCSDSTRKLL